MPWLDNASRRLGLHPRAGLGAAVVIGGSLVWAFAFSGGFTGLFGGKKDTLKVEFANVQSLVKNDPVRIKGVQVGAVSKVSSAGKGAGGTVTIRLDKDTGPLFADARASILWRTALGANDAIAIDPGTHASGPLGSATIPRSRTSSQVELDEITRSLNGGAQQGLRTTFKELGPAFSSRSSLKRGFESLRTAAPDVTSGLGALRGEVRDKDLQALVRETARATSALAVGTHAGTTRRFVQSAATTLGAMADADADVRRSIAGLAVVLPHAGRTLTSAGAALDRLDPLTAKLTTAAPSVAPTLQALRPAVIHADQLLRGAAPLLEKLRPTVRSLAGTARVGVPVIDDLQPTLQRLDEKVLPTLAETTPETRGHPAYTMFGAALGGLGPISHAFDIDGPQVNLTAGLEEPQAAQILPCTEDFSGTPLLVCNSLADALGTTFGAGTSLLQNIVPLPGPLDELFKGKIAAAQARVRRFNDTRRKLTAHNPALARRIFGRQPGVTP